MILEQIKRDLDLLVVRYQQELAFAVKFQPHLRRQIMRIDGLARYHLGTIRAVFETGREVTDVPISTDGRWPTWRRLYNSDLFLMLTQGLPPVEMWGAHAISATSMIRKLYGAAENIIIEAFRLQEEFGGKVFIEASQEKTSVGTIPRTTLSCSETAVTFTTSGRGAAQGDDVFCPLDDVDFITGPWAENDLISDVAMTFHVSDLSNEHRDQADLELAAMEMILSKVESGQPLAHSDIVDLKGAMTFAAAWRQAANEFGLPEVFITLDLAISNVLPHVVRSMPVEDRIKSWELWEFVTWDGLPRRPVTSPWSKLHDFYKGTASPSVQQADGHGHGRTTRPADMNPAVQNPLATEKPRLSYERKRLAERFGISASKLDKLRTKLECKKSKAGYGMLISEFDALKLARHLVSKEPHGSKAQVRVAQFLEEDFPNGLEI